MFSEITSYKDKDFFDSHLTGKLYAIDTVYDLKVLGFSIVDASSWHYYNLDRMKNGHNQEIIQYIRESGQNTQLDEAKYEKLLLLSTCDKDSKHYRNIILLSMTPRD